MTNKQEKIPLPFTYYCNTKEEGNCPLIPTLIKIHKSLKASFEKNYIFNMTIAATNGKRLLLSKNITSKELLKREEFCEIIDLDPVKQTVLYFGLIHPPEITPYLWMIHHAKKEIQITTYIHLKNPEKLKEIPRCKPAINKQQSFIENIKIIMKHLQKTDELFITNNELILSTHSIQNMKEKINSIQELIK